MDKMSSACCSRLHVKKNAKNKTKTKNILAPGVTNDNFRATQRLKREKHTGARIKMIIINTKYVQRRRIGQGWGAGTYKLARSNNPAFVNWLLRTVLISFDLR